MVTPKQQYSVFNLLPPSGGNYCSNEGLDGLDRMRNFNMRRNSIDGTHISNNADTHNIIDGNNQRGSLTPGIDFGGLGNRDQAHGDH